MNSYRLVGIVLLIVTVLSIIPLSFYLSENTTFEKKIGNCYDRFGSKILGVECEKNIVSQPVGVFLIGTFGIALMIILSTYLMQRGDEYDY